MGDARPPLAAALGAFGLPATVTPPGGDPVVTTAIWLPPITIESPVGAEFRRAEKKRVLALPLLGLPEMPRGTIVTVPESEGAESVDWSLDEAERMDSDHYRALVVPA